MEHLYDGPEVEEDVYFVERMCEVDKGDELEGQVGEMVGQMVEGKGHVEDDGPQLALVVDKGQIHGSDLYNHEYLF